MKLQDYRDRCQELGIPFTKNDTINQLSNKIRLKEMSEETKQGVITDEQIAEWKRKHKTDKLHKLSVKVAEGDIAVGYLKPPKREVKATALSMYSQNKILECGEFIRNNCWLGGDERLMSDGDVADSAAIQASGVIKFLEAELGEV
ncbi:hypothetical protein HZP15_06780 [Elizabethkingia anophelis]|nr:hypothetical protein [Elizabethkingia anophelis]BBQ07574.1 hypothetical protein JUNP353_2145 [Elizabethkingia anophelis]